MSQGIAAVKYLYVDVWVGAEMLVRLGWKPEIPRSWIQVPALSRTSILQSHGFSTSAMCALC